MLDLFKPKMYLGYSIVKGESYSLLFGDTQQITVTVHFYCRGKRKWIECQGCDKGTVRREIPAFDWWIRDTSSTWEFAPVQNPTQQLLDLRAQRKHFGI